jgi:hypothetical protein
MEYGRTLFFDEFAGDFHPTFKKALSEQLFAKGSQGTGIRLFEKYNFLLIVGMIDPERRIVGDQVFAKIEFVTPDSCSVPVGIVWQSGNQGDLNVIHTQDISDNAVEFNWSEDFPLHEVLPHIRPYRIDKKDKTHFNFDVEYYYHLLPDLSLEFTFSKPLNSSEIETIDTFFSDFKTAWNEQNKGKSIEFVSGIRETGNNIYTVVLDIGLKNDMKTVKKILHSYFIHFGNLPAIKISVK